MDPDWFGGKWIKLSIEFSGFVLCLVQNSPTPDRCSNGEPSGGGGRGGGRGIHCAEETSLPASKEAGSAGTSRARPSSPSSTLSSLSDNENNPVSFNSFQLNVIYLFDIKDRFVQMMARLRETSGRNCVPISIRRSANCNQLDSFNY